MTQKYYRCCYTNDTWQQDGRLASGWRTVAASPDLPQQARDTCSWMQSSVVPTRPVNLDEDGNPLNLLEIAGDGQFFYLIRTQYGLQDREGRANIFSHGYIFPADAALTANPALLLAAAGRENFGQTAAEAEAKVPAFTGSLPTLAEAMALCGLDEARYLTLIRCVYLQMTQRQALWPLYLQCRDEEEMKALLCCIYAALPPYLRRCLCASSAEMERRGRNLIFVRSVAERSHWLIPGTGENDLLTPRTIQRLERLEFVDYPVRCGEDQRTAYFDRLEGEAERLTAGLPALAASDSRQELIHKIAHQLICGGTARTGEELEIRLADALRAPQTDNLDQYLANLLEQYSGLGLFLTPEAEEELAARVQSSHLTALTAQMEAYDRRRLLNLSPEEGARALALRGREAVEKLRPWLLADAQGTEMLDRYEAAALGDTPDWKTLWQGVQAVSTMPLPLTRTRIETLAWQCYERELSPGTARQTFEDYMALVSRLYPDNTAKLGERARRRYWQDFSLTHARPEQLAEMNFFLLREDRRCQVALAFAALPICREKKGVRQFLRTLCDFYSKYRSDLSRMDGESAISRLRQRMEGQAARENDLLNRYIGHWMTLAVRLTPEELDQLMDLVKAASEGREEDFVREAAGLLEVVNRQAGGELAWLRSLLSRLWQQQERSGSVASLDVWLSLAVPGENPFLSLSAFQPGVLDLPPKEVASSSRLLFQPQIRQYADEYQRGGELSRTVKQWMGAVRQLEKKGLAPAVEPAPQKPRFGWDSGEDRPEPQQKETPQRDPAPPSQPAEKATGSQGGMESVFDLLHRRPEENRADAPVQPEPAQAQTDPEPPSESDLWESEKEELESLYTSMDRFLGKEAPEAPTPKTEETRQGSYTGPMTSGASVRPLDARWQEKEKEPEPHGPESPAKDHAALEKGHSGGSVPDLPQGGNPVRSGASVRPQDVAPPETPAKPAQSQGFSSYQPTPPRYFDQEFDTLRSGASVRHPDLEEPKPAPQPEKPAHEAAAGPAESRTEPAPSAPDGSSDQAVSLLDRLKEFFRK